MKLNILKTIRNIFWKVFIPGVTMICESLGLVLVLRQKALSLGLVSVSESSIFPEILGLVTSQNIGSLKNLVRSQTIKYPIMNHKTHKQLVRAACVRCTKLSVHYLWRFLSFFFFFCYGYFSPRRGCPRVLKFCMGF